MKKKVLVLGFQSSPLTAYLQSLTRGASRTVLTVGKKIFESLNL